jgi:hypothetical protein
MRIKGVVAETASEPIKNLLQANAERVGRVALPLTAFAHCPAIAEGYEQFGAAFRKSRLVEGRLETLACIRAAQMAGCPF